MPSVSSECQIFATKIDPMYQPLKVAGKLPAKFGLHEVNFPLQTDEKKHISTQSPKAPQEIDSAPDTITTNGIYQWTISEWDRQQTPNKKCESDVFYFLNSKTNKNYQFRLTLHPKGSGMHKISEHVTISFILMKHHDDEANEFPFAHEIQFSLTKKSTVYVSTIKNHSSLSIFEKPVREENHAGDVQLLPFSKIDDYVHNNSLTITALIGTHAVDHFKRLQSSCGYEIIHTP